MVLLMKVACGKGIRSTTHEQSLLERDSHGNVQVAKIETEKMLITMVKTELEKQRVEGKYAG
ncbi:Pyrophosphate--fructose 6-phosphate 1-phosphotransferase subunit beta 2 [Nymphaea thermarum]|nr:Pyrophosphate--fructose 6-phosphate 1-phosphotransferase subunit beta 2 [Nymphaea thermarum]